MLYCSYVKQKASNWTLFAFIALALFATSNDVYANKCTLSLFDETAKVTHVYDGDTIKLNDGRKLRLIGINTPERGRDGRNDEPFYAEAKQQLQKILDKNNQQIKIAFGNDKRDRYKRYLAHIFTLDNKNITAMLLKKGLGLTIAIPPNVQLLNCYQNAERKAKTSNLGIWELPQSSSIDITSLNKTARGFHRVSGKIDRIGESRSSFWLNMNSKQGTKFALRILKKNLSYFNKYHPKSLLNKKLIARGWIYEIKGKQRMSIHHPASLELQNTD